MLNSVAEQARSEKAPHAQGYFVQDILAYSLHILGAVTATDLQKYNSNKCHIS